MVSFRAKIWLVLGLLTAVPAVHLMSGCAGKSVDENDPAGLYKEAEEDIKSDHYLIAIEKLKTIKNKFPYSNYATEAQLKIADVYYMQESYGEAAVAYEAFRDLHPKHEKVPYAMFRIAKSYYNDIPSPVERDMTPAQKALDAYNDFLHRFPGAPEAVEAKKDSDDVRNLLAEKELLVANFYFKRDFYESAKPRYRKILDLYPDTPSASDARDKLARIDKIEEKLNGEK